MLTEIMLNRAFLPAARTTRRGFLIGAAAVAGGFAVGFRPVGALAAGRRRGAGDQPVRRLRRRSPPTTGSR